MSNRKLFIELTRRGQNKRLRKERLKQYCENDNSQPLPLPSTSNVHLSSNDILGSMIHQNESHDDSNSHELEQACESNNHLPNCDNLYGFLSKIPDSDDSDDSVDDNFLFSNNGDDEEKLSQDIRNWYFQYHITHIALTSLLCILKSHKCFQSLPSDSRTLLKTPFSSRLNIQSVGHGSYFHFGIAESIKKLWLNISDIVTSNCIDLLFGIDGLPLFKSGPGEFWPILVSIINFPSLFSCVTPVGLYFGKKKPENANTFLKAFVEEMNEILHSGILINGKRFFVKLKGFCCDAPAKSFILATKGHSGYSSCTKCKQVGSFFSNRVTFPDIPSKVDLERNLRTTRGFLLKEDPDFHTGDTILTNVPGLDFISSFPLDYMHLVCLGVTRTILYIWAFAQPPLKFPSRIIDAISLKLRSLQSFIPSEFSRKPRGLEDLKRWKATEFRQFLLYTGPLVLKDIFYPDRLEIYENFLHLHIAMRILLSPKFCTIHNAYADELLSRFLMVFKITYGQQFMTHNFHNLLHLSKDVETFGSLDNCSAFKFENYLHTLKKLIRKADKPLAQVIKRLSEKSTFNSLVNQHEISTPSFPYCSNPHFEGPLLPGFNIHEQYRKLHFERFSLSTNSPNSCCSLTDGSIAIIYNIVYLSTLQPLYLIVQKFQCLEEFFGHPFCSSTSLGIYLVSKLSNIFELEPVSKINEKIVLLPAKDRKHLALPFLHIE